MLISGIQQFTMLDYPGRVSSIVFLPGCNFRCVYCHNPEFVLPNEICKIRDTFISEEIFFNFLDRRTGLLDGVVVSGGEPTLHHELPQFLKKIKDRGFLVKLDTNGYNPKMLEEIISLGLVDYIAMDIKSSISSYAAVVSKDIHAETIIDSIDLIEGSGIPYEFRSTLIKELHTHEVLKGMANMLEGAHMLYLQTFRPGHTLSPVAGSYHSFTVEELKSIGQDIFAPYVDRVGVR